MEKVRLILDSSSNTLSDPARNLVVVPLTLTFGEENMLDDEKLDISEFLAKMEANNEAGKTAAPSIQRWLDALEGSENAIIVTLTSGLSGTYSSALQAKDIYLEQHPHANVIVVDSRSAGPELEVVLEGIEALIKDDKPVSADVVKSEKVWATDALVFYGPYCLSRVVATNGAAIIDALRNIFYPDER